MRSPSFGPSGRFVRLPHESALRAARAAAPAKERLAIGGVRRDDLRMAKTPTKKSKIAAPLAKNANPKGAKLTPKKAKAAAHKAPERRNENKVRGR